MKEVSLPQIIRDSLIPATGTPWERITNDLREECGYNIISFQEMIDTPDDISDAIPIIVRHVLEENDAHVISGLVMPLLHERYLHLIDVKPIIAKYRTFNDTWLGTSPSGGKGEMAHLISLLIKRSELHNVYKDFLDDRSLGTTRIWFLNRLAKEKPSKEFYDYLVKLTKDPNEQEKDAFGNSLGLRAEIILKSKKFDQFRNH